MDSTHFNYKYLKSRKVGIIGVSVKEGQDLHGPELAPEHLRSSGLHNVITSLDWEYLDYGDIKEVDVDKEKHDIKNCKVKNPVEMGAVCGKLHSIATKIANSGAFTLTLGGDHGIASGSISAMKKVYPDLKIIWIDAHADANTPDSSPSGNYHGMPVAHLLGWFDNVPGFEWFNPCITKDDIVLIGLRDLDKEERHLLKKNQIKCFTMHDVLKLGINKVVDEAIKYLNKDGDHPIHISFDIDGVDPSIAYGTGTKSRGGLLYREAHYLVREIVSTGCVVGLDMVEINPLLDKPKEHFHGDNKLIDGTETVALGLELIASTLGETLL